MIHFRKEGKTQEIGLNIATGRPYKWKRWISFTWVWYKPETYTLSNWRVRIRPYMWPFIIFSKGSHDVIDKQLFDIDGVIVSKAILED